MRGLLCIILFSKCLHARPMLEASELPRECGMLAHCADAAPLCVKIKNTMNHHVTLDKCQLQFLRCQPGRVEVAPVPMKYCQGDQLSKDAGIIKKRVRRHLEESTTEGMHKTIRHRRTTIITQHSRNIGRSNVKENNKAKRKRGKSLKKPSRDRDGATHTQKKFKNKAKPVLRNLGNIRISKGKSSKIGRSNKQKPLAVDKMAPNFLNHKQLREKGNKKLGRPHVPGSLAAPLDYGAIINNRNDETRQGFTMNTDPEDPGNSAEEFGEANQGDVGGSGGDVGGSGGDGGVNEGDGEADEGSRGVNEDGDVASENVGANDGDDGENEGDSDANKGDDGVKDGDRSENEGHAWVNEGDGEVNEADGEPDEGDREVNEDDEGREVANEENTDNILRKGDNDEENNADSVEKVGDNDENGNDGGDNADNEGGNDEDNMIANVNQLANLGLWKSIQDGLRGVSVKFNLAVNSG